MPYSALSSCSPSSGPLTTSLSGPSCIVFNVLQLPVCSVNRPNYQLGSLG